jgi:hypothetical protein
MTSVGSMPKQSNGHFIILSSLVGSTAAPCVLTYSGSSGSGASATVGNFTNADWAAAQGATLTPFKLLKDMGVTVMSSGRMFRKVAPMPAPPGDSTPNPFAGGANTFGVNAASDMSAVYTGFIELGYEGFGNPSPVARYNSL